MYRGRDAGRGSVQAVAGLGDAGHLSARRLFVLRYTQVVFRRLLFLLVCLGLALQAPAVRALDTTPCPMEAPMRAMLAAGDLNPMDLPDCCNDMLTFAATGHLCKPGFDCGSATTVICLCDQPSASPAAAVSFCTPARPAPPFAAPIAQPWRPPAGR